MEAGTTANETRRVSECRACPQREDQEQDARRDQQLEDLRAIHGACHEMS